ncbi:MAG: putative endonuclease [Glaciecola sp.]|jgi:putative endonuclease
MTNSIDRRLEEHRLGLNIDCYTYKKRPLTLIYDQEFIQFNQAEYYEKKIKKWSRSKKLALANEDFELLKYLSICKNDTNYKNFEK